MQYKFPVIMNNNHTVFLKLDILKPFDKFCIAIHSVVNRYKNKAE